MVVTLWNCGTVRERLWFTKEQTFDAHIQAIATALAPDAIRRDEQKLEMALQQLVDFCREQADTGYADKIRNHRVFMYVATVCVWLQEMQETLNFIRRSIHTLSTDDVQDLLEYNLENRVVEASTWRSTSEDAQTVLTLLSGGVLGR